MRFCSKVSGVKLAIFLKYSIGSRHLSDDNFYGKYG